MFLNDEQKEIIKHTVERAANERYCGDSNDMQFLVDKNLMKSIGSFLGNKYFTVTKNGREYYNVFFKRKLS